MSHDFFFPAATGVAPGYAIEAGHERIACREVRGFGDALIAAHDALAPAPARLVILGPEADGEAWLDAWSEDAEQVRRALVIRRADGAEVVVIATLASHGYGVPTSLAVESVRARGAEILRSGVHLKVDVEAVLASWDLS